MAHEDIHVHVQNLLPTPTQLTITEAPDVIINAAVTTTLQSINLNIIEEDPVIINVEINNSANTPIDITVFDPLFSLDQSFHINGSLDVSENINTETLFIDLIEIDPSGASINQALVFNGTKFVPSTITSGGGGSSRFEYQQTTPASQWTIAHGLNGYPLINVVDSAGTQIFGDVTYPSNSQVIISFTAPFSGVASLI